MFIYKNVLAFVPTKFDEPRDLDQLRNDIINGGYVSLQKFYKDLEKLIKNTINERCRNYLDVLYLN